MNSFPEICFSTVNGIHFPRGTTLPDQHDLADRLWLQRVVHAVSANEFGRTCKRNNMKQSNYCHIEKIPSVNDQTNWPKATQLFRYGSAIFHDFVPCSCDKSSLQGCVCTTNILVIWVCQKSFGERPRSSFLNIVIPASPSKRPNHDKSIFIWLNVDISYIYIYIYTQLYTAAFWHDLSFG